MKFGPLPLTRALGAVLAHSLPLAGGRLLKGCVLGPAELARLRAAGLTEVTVARADPGDIAEDQAAQAIAGHVAGPGIALATPLHGRVNLTATAPGVLRVNGLGVAALNRVDEAITLASLPDYARVGAGTLVATAKMIPYFVDGRRLASACVGVAPLCTLHAFQPLRWALLLTRVPGMKASLLTKARAVTEKRVSALCGTLVHCDVVEHTTVALAEALKAATGKGVAADVILILTGSATSDRADVAPLAVGRAGGRVSRFGMPVDPGNLLFLAQISGRPVIGLPGCARAPALNGADWVLERIAAGLPLGDAEIASMGAGGLLKEVPERGEPRRRRAKAAASRPNSAPEGAEVSEIHVLLLAAGASMRMRGADKLLRDIHGEPLLRRSAHAACNSGAARVHVTLPEGNRARRAALEDLDLLMVPVANPKAGMAASLRAGIAALPASAGAVIIALADMPDLTPAHYDALITAAKTSDPDEILRARTAAGTPGHPVLFGRGYFEELAGLQGDQGARALLQRANTRVRLIPTPGSAAACDLDTPEDFDAWEQRAQQPPGP